MNKTFFYKHDDISRRIKTYRDDHQMTQVDLANKLKISKDVIIVAEKDCKINCKNYRLIEEKLGIKFGLQPINMDGKGGILVELIDEVRIPIYDAINEKTFNVSRMARKTNLAADTISNIMLGKRSSARLEVLKIIYDYLKLDFNIVLNNI